MMDEDDDGQQQVNGDTAGMPLFISLDRHLTPPNTSQIIYEYAL